MELQEERVQTRLVDQSKRERADERICEHMNHLNMTCFPTVLVRYSGFLEDHGRKY